MCSDSHLFHLSWFAHYKIELVAIYTMDSFLLPTVLIENAIWRKDWRIFEWKTLNFSGIFLSLLTCDIIWLYLCDFSNEKSVVFVFISVWLVFLRLDFDKPSGVGVPNYCKCQYFSMWHCTKPKWKINLIWMLNLFIPFKKIHFSLFYFVLFVGILLLNQVWFNVVKLTVFYLKYWTKWHETKMCLLNDNNWQEIWLLYSKSMSFFL